MSAQAIVSHDPGPVSSYLSCLYLYKATLARRRETRPQNLVRADLKKLRPPLRAATAASRARAAAERPAPAIELSPVNDLENQHPAQPVAVPGDDDYTLS